MVSQLTAKVRELTEINSELCSSHNALLADGAKWQSRAESAEATAEPAASTTRAETQPTTAARSGPTSSEQPVQLVQPVQPAARLVDDVPAVGGPVEARPVLVRLRRRQGAERGAFGAGQGVYLCIAPAPAGAGTPR